MKRKAFIRPAAQKDIDHQAAYLADHAGTVVAQRFLVALNESISGLLEQPGMGSVWPTGEPRLRDIRRQRITGFPNHLLFYQFDDTTIEVLHLYHGHQDIEARLQSDDDEEIADA